MPTCSFPDGDFRANAGLEWLQLPDVASSRHYPRHAPPKGNYATDRMQSGGRPFSSEGMTYNALCGIPSAKGHGFSCWGSYPLGDLLSSD